MATNAATASGPSRSHRAAASFALALALACVESPESVELGSDSVLPPDTGVTVYVGGDEAIVAPLLERFRARGTYPVDARFGDTWEWTTTLLEEGARSPAQVFLADDVRALAELSEAGLLSEIPADTARRIPARYRSHRGDWVGLSGQEPVIVYDSRKLATALLPQPITLTTDPRFRGRFGLAPDEPSFSIRMALYHALHGDEALHHLLSDLTVNEPRVYPDHAAVVTGVSLGEIDWGLVCRDDVRDDATGPSEAHLAIAEMRGTDSEPTEALSVGLLRGTPASFALVAFLVSEEAQRSIAEESGEEALAALGGEEDDVGNPRLEAGAVARSLAPTLARLRENGLTGSR